MLPDPYYAGRVPRIAIPAAQRWSSADWQRRAPFVERENNNAGVQTVATRASRE
jgi:hypothetical protein